MARHRRMRVEPLEERRMLAASFTGTYTQDFDTLPTSGTGLAWQNDVTLEGWHLFRQPAPGTALTTIDASDGSSSVGSFYSFGVAGAGPLSDRALGVIGSGDAYFSNPTASGTVAGWMALALDNDSGSTIDELYFNFTGEQWRDSNQSSQGMNVEYGIGATFQAVTSWSAFAGFSSPTSDNTGALDGNLASNRREDIDPLLTNLNWTAGSTLWFRWVERNDQGNDHALAIDDVQINTLPILAVDTLVDENDGDYSAGDLSLREAISIAGTATRITFDPSLTSGGPASIVLTEGDLVIDKDMVIEGPGANLLTIDASGNDPTPEVDNNDGSGVFRVASGFAVISGLTITGGDGPTAVEGISVLQSSKVTGNHGTFDIVDGYDSLIEDCEITGNSAFSIVRSDGPYGVLEIRGTTISNNIGRAVNLSSGGQLSIADSTISGNVADKGAGIYLRFDSGDAYLGTSGSAAFATITNTVISGNTATSGSAIYGAASQITLIDSTVSGNLGAGAAIFRRTANLPHNGYTGGDLTLDNTHVINNAGSGVVASGTTSDDLVVIDSDISGNGGTGLAFNETYYEFSGSISDVSITNSSFNNNASGLALAGNDGGLLVTIQGSEIKDNTATGGLALLGSTDAEIIETTISGNHSSTSGGGIVSPYSYSSGPLLIRNSTISGNSSDSNGGGISFYGPYLTIEESTISGNSADGDGGGLWFYSLQNAANISRTTIANNSAGGSGGGLYAATNYEDGGIDVAGSIIADNLAAVGPDFFTLDNWFFNYSLIENPGSTTVVGTGNIVGADPMLGPLQDNGGPTFTHALLAGSPAIDAGDPAAEAGMNGVPLYDQRGEPIGRVRDGDAPEDIAIDMGAFEVQMFVPPVSGDFDGDGDVDGRDFLLWQRGGSPSPLSGGDLELWEDNYGENELLAVSSQLLASQELRAEGGEPEIADFGFRISDGEKPRPAGKYARGYENPVFEDSYVEEVDRALEQLGTVPNGVRSFGEMVARRAMKRPFLAEPLASEI